MAVTIDAPTESVPSLALRWHPAFAGMFIAMLVYFILMSLGLALGAGGVRDMIAYPERGWSLGTGAGIWVLITVLISLFAGSYASGRVSGLIATRVGLIQGGVVAALFFTLMLTQAGVAFGTLAAGLSAIKDAAGGTASQMANSSRMTAIVEDAIGDLNLKSPPETVAAGVLSRLMRADTGAAIDYLERQSGIPRAEAQARFERLAARVKATAADLGRGAADTARAVGWAAFVIMLLGGVSAMGGGALGAQVNMRSPLGPMDRKALRMQRPAYT